VAIRNIRREANDLLKTEEKNGRISEDNLRLFQEEVQELTKNEIEKVDKILELKEKEIMEV
jgi:ribosome recycling factor